jgi:hypothetical protein
MHITNKKPSCVEPQNPGGKFKFNQKIQNSNL